MTGILLTQNGTPIIGDVAKLMGWIMNVLFNFLDQRIRNPEYRFMYYFIYDYYLSSDVAADD